MIRYVFHKDKSNQSTSIHSFSPSSNDILSLVMRIAIVILFAALFFKDILPHASAIQKFALVIANVACFLGSLTNRFTYRMSAVAIFWLIFISYVLFNRGPGLFVSTGSGWLILFLSSMLLSILLSPNYSLWLLYVFRIIVFFASIHAVSLIIFMLFPSLYSDFYRPVFLSKYTHIIGVGYRAALNAHYSTTGMYLVLGLLADFSMNQSTYYGNRSWQHKYAVSILLLVALVLSTKRAHLVFGVLVCVLIYTIAHLKEGIGTPLKAILIVLLSITAFYLLSLVVPDVSRVVERLSIVQDDETFGGRTGYYNLCIELWKSSPIFGSGWESFTTALYRTQEGAQLIARSVYSQDAHNVFLQLLAEEGVIGLLLFLIASLGSVGVTVHRVIRLQKYEDVVLPALDIMYASLSIQFFFLLYCITGNPLYTQVMFMPYLLSCTVSYDKEPSTDSILNL